MLAWTRVEDSWFGNGYRIVRERPGEWLLLDATSDDQHTVDVDPYPIANLPTLSACKYKAEHLHDERQVELLRKRLAATGVAALAVAVLAGANPVLAVTMGVIAGSATLELIVTWFEGRVGRAREFLQ